MKTKKFDCVEMKNRIQAAMLADYRQRQDEYASLLDFAKARVEQSDWARQIRKKLGAPTKT